MNPIIGDFLNDDNVWGVKITDDGVITPIDKRPDNVGASLGSKGQLYDCYAFELDGKTITAFCDETPTGWKPNNTYNEIVPDTYTIGAMGAPNAPRQPLSGPIIITAKEAPSYCREYWDTWLSGFMPWIPTMKTENLERIKAGRPKKIVRKPPKPKKRVKKKKR